jgi:predicted DNA binding CopG/RHH family protein/uncharacterized DUF497 family protein
MDLTASGFDWDDGNSDKCQTHGVSVSEIELAFQRPMSLFADPTHSQAEQRLKAIGTSASGRRIFLSHLLFASVPMSCLSVRSVHVICTRKRSDTMKNRKPRLKKLPVLKSDEAAEHFVATADLSEYDLSGMMPVQFEFRPKTERVNMRVSKGLLDSIKARAAREGISYQRFIRETLERAIATSKR